MRPLYCANKARHGSVYTSAPRPPTNQARRSPDLSRNPQRPVRLSLTNTLCSTPYTLKNPESFPIIIFNDSTHLELRAAPSLLWRAPRANQSLARTCWWFGSLEFTPCRDCMHSLNLKCFTDEAPHLDRLSIETLTCAWRKKP